MTAGDESARDPRADTPKPVAQSDTRPAGLPDWYQAAHDQLNSLAALAANWDGYNAKPMSADTYGVARRLIQVAALLAAINPQHPPACVPLADGDIQLEWHENDRDLTIHVETTGDISLYVDDAADPWPWNDQARRARQ